LHGAKRRKIQIAASYAVLGLVVLGVLIWQQKFPPLALWLAFAVAFAFFDCVGFAPRARVFLAAFVFAIEINSPSRSPKDPQC